MIESGNRFSEDQPSGSLAAWEQRFDRQIDRLVDEQIEIRRHLHAHPEPSGEELETTQFIADRLRAVGMEPRICRSDAGNPVGVLADLDIGQPDPHSPLIAIRADMDALRMPDEKTVSYRSKRDNCAHACGHDAHTSILLGIALSGAFVHGSLADELSSQGVRLRFVFQPAEETSGGARWLVAQGAMAGVDAILGLHVDPERHVGTVGIRYGVLTANCDEVTIVVDGHGGHAARPHHSRDPVAAACHLVGSLYELLPRTVDSRNPSVFTVGRINGGYAPNVIPEDVTLAGSLRTTDPETREVIKKRIERICTAVELSTGTSISVDFSSPLQSVNNDLRVTRSLHDAARGVLGEDNVIVIDKPSMGGEDFSVYLDHVPGALLRLGCATPGVEWPFLHSPRFDIDEQTLAFGTRVLVRAALRLALPDGLTANPDLGANI